VPSRTSYDIEWWQEAAERCPVAVAFVNGDGRYGYVNAAFSKLLGWSRVEVVGKHWSDLTPLAEIGEGQLTELAGKAGTLVECYETKHLRTKAGGETLVSMYAHRMPAHGDYRGWVMFITDATGTREAVESLKSEYLKLQGRFEHMQDESVKCQAACLAEIKRAQEEARANTDRLNDLTEALIGRNGGGSRVSIGGDYSGRDKTNAPTIVLVWVVVAAMALGLAAMGARLVAGMDDGKPQVTVEP
jgi:PAS domain S-box-containing protein